MKLDLKVINIDWLNYKVIRIDFKILSPPDFSFEPGQHVNLSIGNNAIRSYTIYSDLSSLDKISIVVSVAHAGAGAKFLKELKVGDSVVASGPYGIIGLNDNYQNKNMVFIATGTGIIPFMTIFHKLVNENVKNSIKLYFGLKKQDDFFFIDKLNKFKKKIDNFDYKVVLSSPNEPWDGLTGYVNDKFKIDTTGNTDYYICGVFKMTRDIKEILLKSGVDKKNIIP